MIKSKFKLCEKALFYLQKMDRIMTIGHYSPKTIRLYLSEVRFIYEYYSAIDPDDINQELIERYMYDLIRNKNATYAKCKSVAHGLGFLYKNVLQKPYVIPSKLYPKRHFKLPNVMSEEQILHLINSCGTIKQRALVELFYSSGIRVSECSHLKLQDIDINNMRIKINQGKGRKDRFTLLSYNCLDTLRTYYTKYQPKEYLFEGYRPGKPMHPRSIQLAVNQCYHIANLKYLNFNITTMRHTFATHLLDNGTNIFTIKELLGHSRIDTTIVYLHLQFKKRSAMVSPLDALLQKVNLNSTHPHKYFLPETL